MERKPLFPKNLSAFPDMEFKLYPRTYFLKFIQDYEGQP